MQILLLPSYRKSGILHRLMPLWLLYIMTLTNIFKITNFEMWISRKRDSYDKYDFYWGWHLSSNAVVANDVIRHPDRHFQGQTFSCYAFAIKYCAGSGCLLQICLDSHDTTVKLLLFQFVVELLYTKCVIRRIFHVLFQISVMFTLRGFPQIASC